MFTRTRLASKFLFPHKWWQSVNVLTLFNFIFLAKVKELERGTIGGLPPWTWPFNSSYSSFTHSLMHDGVFIYLTIILGDKKVWVTLKQVSNFALRPVTSLWWNMQYQHGKNKIWQHKVHKQMRHISRKSCPQILKENKFIETFFENLLF